MAKGVYFQCDNCQEAKLINLHDKTRKNRVFERFQELPDGWVEMEVPYCEPSEGLCGGFTDRVQVCGVDCAIKYIQRIKVKMKEFAELMKAEETDEWEGDE